MARTLEDPANELWLSPISVWELLILAAKGRVTLDQEAGQWAAAAMRAAALREAPVTHEVALEARHLHLPPRDPAGRFLAATAKVYHLTLVTADRRLLALKGISTLPNR